MSKKYVKITRCFFKKKNENGGWDNVEERPAILMETRYGKIKFNLKDVGYIVDRLMELQDENYIYEEE